MITACNSQIIYLKSDRLHRLNTVVQHFPREILPQENILDFVSKLCLKIVIGILIDFEAWAFLSLLQFCY